MSGTTHPFIARPVTAEGFARFGELLAPGEDGAPPSAAESALDLSQGAPRFYLMELEDKPARFRSLTRHRRVTQVLASVGGGEWLLAVAAPTGEGDDDPRPGLADVAAFRIPGDVAVLLHRGTWHAGPYFDGERMSFFNLELADTNVVDHQSHPVAGDGICTIEAS
ncbi:ureidoglycolate lyase [Herbiconiux moechotypicola]|uniref:Ureidoglycolate hydrolase n=1 Tax=Herbiconiux moechotypicola TaxID=637393 RepID=A0ABN3DKX1_9MICO|nr:ureidoglycolate lyase [Herbiconiux moechotypicola]MCS5730096.1 ureidoglycolate lyase [Herbiconiux moechotypicola]